MELAKKKANWFTRLNHRLSRTGDSEPEQAKLRLAIGVSLAIYYCIPWSESEQFSDIIKSTPSLIIVSATSIAFIIFAAIVKNPKPSPTRRVCGTMLDIVSLSIIMYWTSGDHVPLFVFYLWVTLGNGFRYGIPYLYISFAISTIGFATAILWSDYWQANQSFAISLLIILLAIPLYAAVLLKKLHAAIASAKQANEAKSRFLANMSHELRTPLNGVIGMGELLKETKLSLEQRELVSTLHSSADTLLELIQNVLDIAKIESGKITIKSQPLDLHAIVNSVIYILSPMGSEKDLEVFCTIDPDTPFSLEGDQQYIRQILINLVNNAIKFTDSGSVKLHVYKKGGVESNPRIRFDIVDTGIGLSPKSMEVIFDDFTQAEKSTTSKYGGSGLGTTISKELVELMDGEIGVSSDLGKGSTFWFELTLKSIPHSDSAISANRIVLLSSEKTATIIRPELKNWEIDFDWVRSSARALSLLIQAAEQGNQYHSAIIDQSALSDINADQFAQMIKSESLLESLSLILVNSSDTMINTNSINQHYISTIIEPRDTRLLFNAIHAAQSVHVTDSNVVTLADHYSKQVGAKILRILVAEDNAVNQQVIQGILKHAGHNVSVVSTGEKALDILSADSHKIDLLILDMNMPKMSGIEVVKALRFLDASHSLPVIMLTADATPEARDKSLAAGANAFLTKPIEVKTLLEKIALLSRNIQQKTIVKDYQSAANKSKSHAPSDLKLYDETVLHDLYLLGDDPHFVRNLLDSFIADGTRHVEQIKKASSHDYLEFRESLHALKGSSTELGAAKLIKASELGETLKPYDIGSEKIEDYVSRLEKTFQLTATAFRELPEAVYASRSGKSD